MCNLPSQRTSLVTLTVKNLPAMQEMGVRSLGQEDPLEKGMATHSRILDGKSHEQRSLADYSLWDHKESDTTERLTLSLSLLPSQSLFLGALITFFVVMCVSCFLRLKAP